MPVRNGHHFADDVRLDGQLASATVYEHGQSDSPGPSKVGQLVECGANRAARVQHVVDDDDALAFDVDRNLRGPDDAARTDGLKVVAVQRDVARAAMDLAMHSVDAVR